jgi:hypothetical protein
MWRDPLMFVGDLATDEHKRIRKLVYSFSSSNSILALSHLLHAALRTPPPTPHPPDHALWPPLPGAPRCHDLLGRRCLTAAATAPSVLGRCCCPNVRRLYSPSFVEAASLNRDPSWHESEQKQSVEVFCCHSSLRPHKQNHLRTKHSICAILKVFACLA